MKTTKKKQSAKTQKRAEIKAAHSTNKALESGTISYKAPAVWTPENDNLGF